MPLLTNQGIGANLDAIYRVSNPVLALREADDAELNQVEAWLELWLIRIQTEKKRRD